MGRLEGKTALITGAAGAQGRVAALTFARQGARVALADINEERVRAVQASGVLLQRALPGHGHCQHQRIQGRVIEAFPDELAGGQQDAQYVGR